MKTQRDKASAFRSLHERDELFVMPNPWDVGSAVMLAGLGYEALATSPDAYALSHGRPDSEVDAETALGHAATLAASVDLPMCCDLESAYGETLEDVAHSIRQACYSGLVGASIDDASGDPAAPIYSIDAAAARIRAAAKAAAALDMPFVVTARTRASHDGSDLAVTIERLRAYAAAGADVVHAPGITALEDLEEIARAVDRPLSVLAASPFLGYDLNDLARIGVRRVSVGSLLYGAAMGAFLRAARELREQGSFYDSRGAASFRELSRFFGVPA